MPLTLTPITGTDEFKPLMSQFDLAIGVRKGDHARRERIDEVLAARRPEIARLLGEFCFPLVTGGHRE